MDEKVIHDQLLAILCAFHELCNQNDIPYTLHGGTLLGAVREHGFILWDDDADVAITRKNFKHLERALCNSDTGFYIRGDIKKQFCEVGNTNAWVDLFVCDHISENRFLQIIKQMLLTMLDIMHRDSESIKLSNLERYSKAKRLVYKIVFIIGQMIPKGQLARWYAYIAERCFLGSRTYMFRSNDQYTGRSLLFPADWMEHYKQAALNVIRKNRPELLSKEQKDVKDKIE